MNRYTRWLLRLIGPALLVFFLWRSDLRAIGAAFAGLDPWPLALSLVLFAPFIAVKSWRWSLIMRELQIRPPSFWYLCLLYTIGLFAGGVTPGQSGDFVKGWYLRERGLPLGPSLFSILLDRLFDLFVMALLALLGLVAFLDVLPADVRPAVQIATIGFAAVVVLAIPTLMARSPREWLLSRIGPVLPARVRAPLERFQEQLAVLSFRPGVFGLLALASAASAASTMLRIWLLYPALQLYDIPLIEIVGSTALIAILQALPISFAGIGVRDAVLVAVLARHGHSPELAISLSTLFLLINIEHILIGFLTSLRYPLGEQPKEGEAAGTPADSAAP